MSTTDPNVSVFPLSADERKVVDQVAQELCLTTIIEIDHDELTFLQDEREQVFPALLGTLMMGEGPCWVGRVFAPGLRIIGQRRQTDPGWTPSWSACSCRSIEQASRCKFAYVCSSAIDVAKSEEVDVAAPSAKLIAMMAGAILGQPEGTCDNRHPYWPQAVEQAQRAHAAFIAHGRGEGSING